MTPRIRLLKTPIDALSLEEAVARVQQLVAQGQGGMVCTPDTTALWRAQQDPALRAIYEEADLVTPDGTGVVWASRVLGMALPERVSGIDLLERLFACGRTLRLFLLGAAPGVAEQAALKLAERYPNLRIVGTHHGYFRPEENEQMIALIDQAQPDVVLVGLGVPRQERWMQENRAKLRKSVLMGVGGCFDVWAGRLMRAPVSWRRLGLEWLYRLIQEPKRVARVSTIPLFVLEVWALKLLYLIMGR
ncbi:MAG: WecB/TagA/CpsF family glycosyltransferase [Candidatus Bipolaricaulota bacterium]|nr:WecB/TagA/CpsF family glycosyltransferase [Candidatus Bipolaricaulota bacterium]MDW8141114.1 WecB/TagA/CpsF family glycosyltransferase [Candidatus Bipolaricaulota bacterium]